MTDTSNPTGVDRRSLLKASAAAGVVAWVAPTIAAQPAWAIGSRCTPKCAPDRTFNVEIIGLDLCANDISGTAILPAGACPTNANKIAVFIVRPQAGTVQCPCSGTPSASLVQLPGTFSKWNQASAPGTSTCVLSNESGVTFKATSLPTPNLQALGASPNNSYDYQMGDTGFVLCKGGAAPDGWLAPSGNQEFCIAIGCVDKTGDTIFQVCKFKGGFNYTPSGSCGTLTPITQFCIQRVACQIQCGVDENGIPVPLTCAF